MAKQPKPIEETEPQVEAVTESITYKPGPMDPPTVKWGGHTFQANMPKELTGHPEGTDRERLNMVLITSARDNRHFQVGNARRRDSRFELPKTSEQYRAYFVGWLSDPGIEHAEELIARLAKDRDLQQACEVGFDDYSYMSTLFMPRLHELQTADELTDPQIASIWVRNGYNQTPW